MDDTIRRLFEGDQRVLSRLLSLIERQDTRAMEVMAEVYPRTGTAYCIGVTGPPGVGKSTIVDSLAEVMRGEGFSVGILAVDPTSPYSGGAFLGDRIRMRRHYLDSGVFVRSMATREGSGGLPRVVRSAVRVLDASGKDVVLLETAGVGQTELGVIDAADTVVVVLMPETGDSIQTLKAGLMEIADIFVVNKVDHEGADQMMAAITSMLEMDTNTGDWATPVLATQANNGVGVRELFGNILRHRGHLEQTSQLESRRSERRGEEFLETIEEELGRRVKRRLNEDSKLEAVLKAVKKGEMEPYSAAVRLLDGDLNAFLSSIGG